MHVENYGYKSMIPTKDSDAVEASDYFSSYFSDKSLVNKLSFAFGARSPVWLKFDYISGFISGDA